jgi:hypothetical protein
MKFIQRLVAPIFLLVIIFCPDSAAAQDFPDVCQQSENILQNCTFDRGLDGWQTFTEAGGADISVLQGGGECHAPLCPAAYIVTEDHFVGGLYQQVPVSKGANYYANIVWLVFDSLVNDASVHQTVGGIGRKIGIDPFGGTDSRSPNVVWSEDNWRNDCKICNIEYVTVTAQADTITVFLRIDDTWRLKAAENGLPVPPSKDQFWIDDIGLKQVGGEPVVIQEEQVESPVETPTSPPDTPTPPPPTQTFTPPAEDTATPVPEDTATPTAEAASPTPEVLPSATPAPPPTLTPTNTPPPTATFAPRPTFTPTRQRDSVPVPADRNSASTTLLLGAAGTTVCIGGITLVGAAIVLFGLVWLYRLGWGQSRN